MDSQTYTISQFCQTHNISKTFFYKLLKEGNVPTPFRLGGKLLITREAAEEWRVKMSAGNQSGAK